MVLHFVNAFKVNPGMQVVVYSPDTDVLVIYVPTHLPFPKEHIFALQLTDSFDYDIFRMPFHSMDLLPRDRISYICWF